MPTLVCRHPSGSDRFLKEAWLHLMLLGQSSEAVITVLSPSLVLSEILSSEVQTELAFLWSGATVHSEAVQITESSPKTLWDIPC